MAAQNKKDELTWMNVLVRVFLNSATHPIEYAKVLIQVWFYLAVMDPSCILVRVFEGHT